jgi:hypothetical protein
MQIFPEHDLGKLLVLFFQEKRTVSDKLRISILNMRSHPRVNPWVTIGIVHLSYRLGIGFKVAIRHIKATDFASLKCNLDLIVTQL